MATLEPDPTTHSFTMHNDEPTRMGTGPMDLSPNHDARVDRVGRYEHLITARVAHRLYGDVDEVVAVGGDDDDAIDVAGRAGEADDASRGS